jgi:hypothetical protein
MPAGGKSACGGDPMRILVIEDEPSMLKGLLDVLAVKGSMD